MTPPRQTPERDDTPPTAIPDDDSVVMDAEDVHVLLHVTLETIHRWEESTDILGNEDAHQYLLRLTQALTILTQAQLRQMGPLVQDKRDDDTAAEAWKDARWRARWEASRRRPGGQEVSGTD